MARRWTASEADIARVHSLESRVHFRGRSTANDRAGPHGNPIGLLDQIARGVVLGDRKSVSTSFA
jgi:hypothetical protein